MAEAGEWACNDSVADGARRRNDKPEIGKRERREAFSLTDISTKRQRVGLVNAPELTRLHVVLV